MRLGDRSEQVSALQKRLTAAGFTGGEEGVFDQATKAAVVQFQKAKGLKVDGIVGPQTLEVLPEANTPKEAPTKAKEAPTKPKEAPTKPKKPSSFFEKDAPLEPFIR